MRLVLKMAFVLAAVLGVGILTTPDHVMVSDAAAAPVPEPSSLMLMAAGVGLLALYRKVRNPK